MPGQAVLRASLRILDLPTKLNGPMEENAFAISFQDHLTLSSNSIQLKMEKKKAVYLMNGLICYLGNTFKNNALQRLSFT